MEPTSDPTTADRRRDSSPRRRNSCFGVFRSIGKSAWRRIGGSKRDGTNDAAIQPPITQVVVDTEHEDEPANPQFDILEVDSKEESDHEFEIPPPQYSGQAPYHDRMKALYARYSLPHDFEDLQDTTANIPIRVSRAPKQRVRVACHLCNAYFKGEKNCAKCGHARCADCKREPVTASTTASKASSIENAEPTGEDQKEALMEDLYSPMLGRRNYSCHECSAAFAEGKFSRCDACGHEKCERCSRLTVHIVIPEEYLVSKDGRLIRQQRVFRPPKQRVRYTCHSCEGQFPPTSSICAKCSHKRCRACSRHPAKRRKTTKDRKGDPEDLQRVDKGPANTVAAIVPESET